MRPDFQNFRVFQRNLKIEPTPFSAKGEELKEIHDLWIQTRKQVVFPPINVEKLEPKALYRLVFPHELVVKLGKRKKLLRNVTSGPIVKPEEIVRQVFTGW